MLSDRFMDTFECSLDVRWTHVRSRLAQDAELYDAEAANYEAAQAAKVQKEAAQAAQWAAVSAMAA